MYWYGKNLQGDIVAVYSSNGTKLINYTYNAWGTTTKSYSNGGASTTAIYNNLTYRGYYYDADLGMYYLQSRYYDSVVCRFISVDSFMPSTNGALYGYNLYVYCFNNPVGYIDPNGNWPKWIENIVDWFEDVDYTVSAGVNINVSTSIFVFNAQVSVSFDGDGNIAIQSGYSAGFTTGSPGFCVSIFDMVTNAPTVNNLEDDGYQVGGSAGIPLGAVSLNLGADLNMIPDDEKNVTYFGIAKSVGIGTPVIIPEIEGHVTWGETWTLKMFNIFGEN